MEQLHADHSRIHENLKRCIELLTECQITYLDAPPTIRRQLNRAFFTHIYLDEGDSLRFELAEPFDNMLSSDTRAAATQNLKDVPYRPDDVVRAASDAQAFQPDEVPWHTTGQGLNKTTMVELRRALSHLTPSVICLNQAKLSFAKPRPKPKPITDSRGPVVSTIRQKQTRVKTDLAAQLVAEYQAGATCYQLAERHGIHRNTVTKHLRRTGIRLRLDGLTAQQIEQGIVLYTSGHSLARIAQQFGVTANTVQARLKEAGVPMRDTHGRPH